MELTLMLTVLLVFTMFTGCGGAQESEQQKLSEISTLIKNLI
ncbi:hypothetical protein QKW52_28215 [Bacillus sonorensis]|nr:hypothetical protein [Bacillus sonorensis]